MRPIGILQMTLRARCVAHACAGHCACSCVVISAASTRCGTASAVWASSLRRASRCGPPETMPFARAVISRCQTVAVRSRINNPPRRGGRARRSSSRWAEKTTAPTRATRAPARTMWRRGCRARHRGRRVYARWPSPHPLAAVYVAGARRIGASTANHRAIRDRSRRYLAKDWSSDLGSLQDSVDIRCRPGPDLHRIGPNPYTAIPSTPVTLRYRDALIAMCQDARRVMTRSAQTANLSRQ